MIAIYKKDIVNMYIYHCGPIDWNWNNLMTVHELMKKLTDKHCFEIDGEDLDGDITLHYVMAKFNQCLKAADEHCGWEGDFTEEPRVFAIPFPYHYDFEFGFVWKQQNNGSTFVACPIELPHLSDCYTMIYLGMGGRVTDLKPKLTAAVLEWKRKNSFSMNLKTPVEQNKTTKDTQKKGH